MNTSRLREGIDCGPLPALRKNTNKRIGTEISYSKWQEANRIARDAAFDRKWPSTASIPGSIVTPSANQDLFEKWQEREALNGIRMELQRLRVNEEFVDSYWILQHSFPPVRR